MCENALNKKRVEQGLLPGNVVLLRGCGIKVQAESFNSRFKTKAAAICPTAIIAGVMLTIAVDRIEPEGATGDYHTNLMVKSEASYKALYQDGYEFVFLHVKGYDEAGHDGSLEIRTDMTKKVELMIGDFMQRVKHEEEDCIVAITGDHSTPLYYGDHTFEPVPFVLTCKKAFHGDAKFFMQDECEVFSEIEAAKGKLGRFAGRGAMPFVFKVKDRLQDKGCS